MVMAIRRLSVWQVQSTGSADLAVLESWAISDTTKLTPSSAALNPE
jgi:hypothetical protein